MTIDFGDLGWEADLPASNPTAARIMAVLARTEGRLCATIAEVATEAGVGVEDVFAALGPYLEEGSIALDSVGDQIFILPYTEPDAAAKGVTRFPPNLWSYLRRRGLADTAAYGIWALIRDLERVGWLVEVRPGHTVNSLGPVRRTPLFAVYIRNHKVPAVVFPSPELLVGEDGWLTEYEAAGADWIAIICREGALDETVTAVREWFLEKEYHSKMAVVVLEEPRYDLVVLRSDDGAVDPADETRMRI